MKTKIQLTFILVAFFATITYAQSKVVTSSIRVYGNCDMCKKRIETSLDQKGIKKASWNPENDSLSVVYNSDKITEQKIHELVAEVGHDTDKVKAKDEVYAKLPFCCLYRENDNPHRDHKDH